jgi:hypothetical protein
MILSVAVRGASPFQKKGSRTRLERSLQGSFARFEDFESAVPICVAGKFQKDRVAAGRKFQGRGGVAEEFVIDEDFGAVGIRGNRDCADGIGNV